MSTGYLIEPLAPLVFRSGKPFGSEVGADGAQFPLPSSLAGLLRTVYADQQPRPLNFAEAQAELLQQSVRGPFLVRYCPDQEKQATLLLPKPADALYLSDAEGHGRVARLAPRALPAGVGSDLPEGLLPVQMLEPCPDKPSKGPQFWALADLLSWQAGQQVAFADLEKNGYTSLPMDIRTHVGMDNHTQAGADGKLFQTASLDFGATREGQKWSDQRLGFWATSSVNLKPDLVTFGGERRLSRLSPLALQPKPAANLTEQVRRAGGLRLTLLTPAIFAGGSLPGWLDAHLQGEIPGTGLRVRLVAQAIERWLPVSGFDLKAWKPKVMRKAVAAGSVYWFEVLGPVPEGLENTLWLQAISDQEQDRRDSFGVVLPSAWQPTSV